MNTEQPECRFCAGCRNKAPAGLNIEDGLWLEEMGEMIAATVEGMRKHPSLCYSLRGRSGRR